MANQSQALLAPRKSPVQARSMASVEAILEATIQVLLTVGKEQLTTTRVAQRAGVSVGTLYQYFPNKSSLLQAALERHLNQVTQALEAVCLAQRGQPVTQMVTAAVTAFIHAKMQDVKSSAAMYAVASDLDGAKLARLKQERSHRALTGMLRTAPEALETEPALMATMLQGVMVGVSRRLLESPSPERQVAGLLEELVFLARAYVAACCVRDA